MVQWTRPNRVHEDAPRYGPLSKIDSTSNAQHSTPNAQLISKIRFDLEERLLDFSVRIIRLVDALPNTRAANHIAGQLLRCGTSTYGNHGEVEAAESRKDFRSQVEGLSEGIEGDSSLATADRKVVDATGNENDLDAQRD
jgi:hypothetical protein